MKLMLKKLSSGVLVPLDYDTEHKLSTIALNDVSTYIKEAPVVDPLLFRKLQKMISIAFENLPHWEVVKSREIFRKRLLVHAGHCEYIKSGSGVEYLVPKSMAYGAINQDDLRSIYKAIYHAIIDLYGDIVPDFTKTFH